MLPFESVRSGIKDHIRIYIHRLLALQNQNCLGEQISEGKELVLFEKALPVILIFLSLPLF